MAIKLTDDGTMDTVLRCSKCGEEFRFNYDPAPDDDGEFPTRDDKILALMDANAGMSAASASDFLDRVLYEEYVDECIAEVASEHGCTLQESDPDDDEPDEDAITTSDHRTFYQYGKQVLVWLTNGWFLPRRGEYLNVEQGDHCAALRAYMDHEQFYPDVYFISDHGNAHLIDLSERGK